MKKNYQTKKTLSEGLSPVLFHAIDPSHAINTIKDNSFKLRLTMGTTHDARLNKGRFYYISFARNMSSGYHLFKNPVHRQVYLKVDGRKLNQEYKGFPVSYWGPETKSREIEYGTHQFEQEDRIVSNSPTIPNAKDYILEVYCFVNTENRITDLHRREFRNLFILCKKNNIPIYFFDNPTYLKSLAKEKALDTSNPKIKDLLFKTSTAPEPSYPRARRKNQPSYLTLLNALYKFNSSGELRKNFEDVFSYSNFDWDANKFFRQVSNEVHNNNYETNKSKATLISNMKKEGATSLKQFVNMVFIKWDAIIEKESKENILNESESKDPHLTRT